MKGDQDLECPFAGEPGLSRGVHWALADSKKASGAVGMT